MTAQTGHDTTCLHHLLALRSSWLTQKEANQGKLQLYTHEMQMRFSNAQCACARHYKFFTDGAWETQDARTHDNRTLYVVLTANSQTTHERQTSGPSQDELGLGSSADRTSSSGFDYFRKGFQRVSSILATFAHLFPAAAAACSPSS